MQIDSNQINQAEIARKLDMSITTVSRALRNHPLVNAQTRQRVKQAAAEMGYALPINLRGEGKLHSPALDHKTIGILSQVDIEKRVNDRELSIHVVPRITMAAQDLDISVMLHYVPREERERLFDPDKLPGMLKNDKIGGLILVHYFPRHVVARLAKQYPCVSLVHYHPGLTMDCVGVEASEPIQKIVSYMVGKGHTRIGHATYGVRNNILAWPGERFSAYVQAIASSGLEYDPDAVIELNTERLESPLDMDLFLRKIDRGVKAWVCGNDRIGFELADGLQQRGYKIGSDILISGFDGWTPPPGVSSIISVAHSISDMGAVALRTLVDRINDPTTPARHIMLEGQIVNM